MDTWCAALQCLCPLVSVMNKSSKVSATESCTEKYLVAQQGFFFSQSLSLLTASCIRRENKREKQEAVLATAGNISTSETFDPVCGHWWKRGALKWVGIYPVESIHQSHLCYKGSLPQHMQILGQLNLSFWEYKEVVPLFSYSPSRAPQPKVCSSVISGAVSLTVSALSLPLPFVPTQLHTSFV